MAKDVEVPEVGESVTEAILLRWHKQEGDRVETDEPLCELETDKANVDLPSPGEGVLERIASEGDTVEVGAVIARLKEGAGEGAGSRSSGSDEEGHRQEDSGGSGGDAEDTEEAAEEGPGSRRETSGGSEGSGETVDVEVPSVGESVSEAIVARWYKREGERVERDEALCELETDKANVDVPAPVAGAVEPLVEEGETVEVGSLLARIREGAGGSAGAREERSSKPSRSNGDRPPSGEPEGRAGLDPAEALSPAVRRLVEENDLDPRAIEGSGRDGRILKEDVLRHLEEGDDRRPPAREEARPPPRTRETQESKAPERPPPPRRSPRSSMRETREPMSKLRRRIAERLVAAQQETAMLTTFNEIDLGEVIELRKQYKESFKEKHGVGLGFMSFFCKATALALQEFPAVNAFIDGEDMVFHDYVNMGIAVSTPRGLVVPVVQDVLNLSLWEVESEIKRVAVAARDGKLGLKEMSGGTFTITNGGVFGSMMSTPILNRPQSAILGMHAIQERPVARSGQVVIRPMMYVALSYDHRIIDGKESVSFLVRVKELLEDPARMLLEI